MQILQYFNFQKVTRKLLDFIKIYLLLENSKILKPVQLNEIKLKRLRCKNYNI